MGKDYCMHGCYPIDKRWSGGISVSPEDAGVDSAAALQRELGEDVYDGKGDFVIEDIFDLRRFVQAFGPEAAESLLNEKTPHGEPYVRGSVDDDKEPVEEKITKRNLSMSMGSQGADMNAYLDTVDRIATHFKFNPVIKVTDSLWASPQSQVHQEFVQRRQQAEQQINRTLGNLADLYQQKQLLEHDLRQLEARLEHVKAKERREEGGGKGKDEEGDDIERDTEDELKADFVDLVDQHTGRHSILQMQANNVFPSITADFYSMTSLEDLESGHLKHLPENEKAVLRKKWKLYQRWKDQFQTAVRSKYQDVKRRLNSVMTSIEQTEEWIKPYVQDIKQITDDFDAQFDISHGLSRYLPEGYANVYRQMKVIAVKDQSPGHEEDQYYDVVVMHPVQASTANPENPQQAGQGLTVFQINFHEYLVCKHVYEEVFEKQIANKKNEVKEYIKKYVGDTGPVHSKEELDERREEIKEKFEVDGKSGKLALGDDEAEMIDNATSMEELDRIERVLEWKHHKPGVIDRAATSIKEFFGATDEFYHPDPSELRRELIGPGFPRQFYLDFKYSNGLFVMK